MNPEVQKVDRGVAAEAAETASETTEHWACQSVASSMNPEVQKGDGGVAAEAADTAALESNEPRVIQTAAEVIPAAENSQNAEAAELPAPSTRSRDIVASAARRLADAAVSAGANTSACFAGMRSNGSARVAEACANSRSLLSAGADCAEPARNRVLTAAEPLAFWRPSRTEAALMASVDSQLIPAAVSASVAKASSHLAITVTDPVKMSPVLQFPSSAEGIAAYIGYKVNTSVTRPGAVDQFCVIRRYKDFLWLETQLWRESAPGVIVPAFPEKTLVGRFSADKVELRRRALQNFLMRVATHPTLPACQSLKAFLEADRKELAKVKENNSDSVPKELCSWATSAANTVHGKLQSFGASKRETDENDDKVAAVRDYLSNLESQLVAVSKNSSGLLKSRRDLATSWADFGQGVQAVSQGEEDLDAVFAHLGSCAERTSLSAAEGAQKEQFHFTEPIKFYLQMIAPVKRALASQAVKATEYDSALNDLTSKERYFEKIKGVAGKEAKATAASLEIENAQGKVNEARLIFETTTQLLLAEVGRFKRDKECDFKKLVADYKHLQVELSQHAATTWATPQP